MSPQPSSPPSARALRLARAIAADIAAFHEPIIVAAIARDTFFDELAGPLEEGLALYQACVGAEVEATGATYWRAILGGILGPRGHISSPMW